MSALWHWVVSALTLGVMAASVWLLLANARDDGSKHDQVWDDDLTERNQPLPRWWFNLFLITVIFGAGYLVLYPGLGNFAGRLGWTQTGEMQQDLDTLRARRDAAYAQFADQSVTALARNPAALALGRDVFLNNCAGCHGADARGALGFPNLTDGDWLYGGAPEAIVASITKGRTGGMPAFENALSPQTVDRLAEFISRRNDPTLDLGTRAEGERQFAITCAACHGLDARGNTAIGAPNLTDAIWLYGGRYAQVRETILHGRSGRMPAHDKILSADQIRMAAAYVLSQSAP